ncbi:MULTISPECIES: SRPBCC domain-containing protein [unclassified Nonomuraea]|uniref:SRPBCC domain-containing protein n=1 Tax=unclassified Nonomuraea TaxID=2593643 RepID=UPI0034017FB4
MTRQDLGDESTTVTAQDDVLLMERVFDAPRELLWTAMTEAEHIPHWYGPHGNTAVVEEMDLRPGGRWRIAPQGPGGMAFTGEFLEVVPPERLVRTSRPDVGPPGPAAVETLTFEDLGGRTRLRWEARFPSADILDFALGTGMTKGILEQFDRLAALLPSLAP